MCIKNLQTNPTRGYISNIIGTQDKSLKKEEKFVSKHDIINDEDLKHTQKWQK